VAPELDRESIDALEQRLWGEIWKSAVPEVAAERGIETRRFGPVQVTLAAGLPDAAWLNLVLGAAAPGAVEDGDLAEALEWADSVGVSHYVPVTPGLDGSEAAERWLGERGYGRGYGWMKFARDAAAPELPEPDGVEIAELGRGQGEEFGEMVAEGFGLPAWAGSLFHGLPGTDGWHCYLAEVDGRPAATGAMLVGDGTAEFGLAATREAARGRGCQLGLLRRRIADAGAAGCRTLFVETGERTAGRPSGSYRNILRAGFEEAYLRPNWQRVRAPGA
jgi:hypothetical protein